MKAEDVAPRRKRLGIKQYDLARRLGLSKATLVDLELGRVDIAPEQYRQLHAAIDAIVDERGNETSCAT